MKDIRMKILLIFLLLSGCTYHGTHDIIWKANTVLQIETLVPKIEQALIIIEDVEGQKAEPLINKTKEVLSLVKSSQEHVVYLDIDLYVLKARSLYREAENLVESNIGSYDQHQLFILSRVRQNLLDINRLISNMDNNRAQFILDSLEIIYRSVRLIGALK